MLPEDNGTKQSRLTSARLKPYCHKTRQQRFAQAFIQYTEKLDFRGILRLAMFLLCEQRGYPEFTSSQLNVTIPTLSIFISLAMHFPFFQFFSRPFS